MSSPPKIFIQGKEYQSIEEVPAELRETYRQMLQVLGDNNGDGLPDIFQGKSFNLNLEKMQQLKEIAQRFKQNPFDENKASQISSQVSQLKVSQNSLPSPSGNNSTIFVIGVVVTAFILMAAAIFLFRSGFFH